MKSTLLCVFALLLTILAVFCGTSYYINVCDDAIAVIDTLCFSMQINPQKFDHAEDYFSKQRFILTLLTNENLINELYFDLAEAFSLARANDSTCFSILAKARTRLFLLQKSAQLFPQKPNG